VIGIKHATKQSGQPLYSGEGQLQGFSDQGCGWQSPQ
jgi:hypothetical protein